MSHWWRAHDEAVDDPKLQRLQASLFKAWFNLMCLASANDGALPVIGDVAFKLHVNEHKATEIINALIGANLFDRRQDGKVEPHNWSGRQFKSDVTDPTAAERMRRYRKKRNSVTENTVTVTATREQITDTEAETDKNSSLRSEPRAKKATTFPDGDWLTEEDRESARKSDVSDIPETFERFKNHALAKGRTAKNWHAAWRNWCSSPYQQGSQNGSRNQQNRTASGPNGARSDSVIAGMASYAAKRFGGQSAAGRSGPMGRRDDVAGGSDAESGAAERDRGARPLLELTAERNPNEERASGDDVRRGDYKAAAH